MVISGSLVGIGTIGELRRSVHVLKTCGTENGVLPNVPIMALTATATEKVAADVSKTMNLRSPHFCKLTFNRTNLFYEVVNKKSVKHALTMAAEFVKSRTHQTGIIYCISRKETERVAAELDEMLAGTSLSGKIVRAALLSCLSVLALRSCAW